MTLVSGSRLGPYEIVAPLGAGGMGEVYRAKDTRLGREVAVKVLPAEVASDPEKLRRFAQEAKVVSALNHPSLLTLFDVGRDGETSYLVTELLDGNSLRQVLASGDPISTKRVLDWGSQIARGLAAAHDQGIVHRDLKPENLFLTRDGRVKILDFGLARLILADVEPASRIGEATTIEELTHEGTVLGTVGYMAPEQVRGERAGTRADLFALGCVLYEMLTGDRAFRGATAADTLSAILRDDPPPIADGSGRRAIPPALKRIVLHCLEKDSSRRFHSASDLAFDLEAVAEQLSPEGVGTPAAVAGISGRRRRPRAALLALAVIAVAVGTLFVFRLADRSPAVATPAPSIAVLPFVNMSSDPEQEYFSDGLAEELLGLLSQIPGLHVAGRTSSFSFKGKSDDLRTIGQKLNVATVLEGSVRKSGQQLRVTAQLVNVADGFHLWSHTYDRTLTDVFALQDEIAGAVVEALEVELLAGAAGTLPKRRAIDPEAHRLYLLGRWLNSRSNDEDYRRALAAFEKAVALDPDYAAAHAGLARAAFQVADRTGSSSAELAEGRRRALAESDRALVLDPEFAEGYSTRAALRRQLRWDWAGAEADYRKAMALDPGDARSHSGLANLYCYLRRFPEGIALGTRATELDPLNPNSWRNLASCFDWAGQPAAARRAWERGLEIYPEDDRARAPFALLRLREGDRAGALSELERLRPGWLRLHGMILSLDALGRRAESEPLLAELIAKSSHLAPFQVAEIFAARGEKERAFEWLDRAYAQRDTGMPALAVEPWFAALYGDPRFTALLRKMNLPDPD